jgi:UDP-N-acetylmuramate-alanine ligase
MYEDVFQSKRGLSFSIIRGDRRYDIESPLLGKYNAENITGCFALACEIGLEPEKTIEAILGFNGMKRRLEKRREAPPAGGVTVIDDIAHSPEKARSVLKNLREIYSGKIVAVYEPNTGNRMPESMPSYKNAFRDADEVVIPKLTRLKIDPNETERAFGGKELVLAIGESHRNAGYFEDDEALVSHITEKREPEDVIVFLGSHGFRGMIEETVKKLG